MDTQTRVPRAVLLDVSSSIVILDAAVQPVEESIGVREIEWQLI